MARPINNTLALATADAKRRAGPGWELLGHALQEGLVAKELLILLGSWDVDAIPADRFRAAALGTIAAWQAAFAKD